MTKLLQLATLIVLVLHTEPPYARVHQVHEVHYQMGTFLSLTMWHSDAELARGLLRLAVQDVHRLENMLSNFNPDSAVSEFNRQAGKGKSRLPSDLYELLKIAGAFSIKTAGYFDVTVGPLVEVWRESLSKGVLPARSRWAVAMQKVGYEKLSLYEQGTAELIVPGMKIDLGGIGKGYAVDRIAKRFESAGIKSAFINFGGSSMLAMGSPPGKPGWEIAMKGTTDVVEDVICLRDMALSTSGSLGKLWTVRGKHYGHIINPKSGVPISVSRVATVVASSATAAEALAKPLVLVGGNARSMLRYFPESEALIFSEHGDPLPSKRWQSKTLCR